MIRRFVGAAAIIVAVLLPVATQTRVSLAASSGVREMVKGRLVLSEQLLAA